MVRLIRVLFMHTSPLVALKNSNPIYKLTQTTNGPTSEIGTLLYGNLEYLREMCITLQ